jgi:dienelactone hydrolase
MKDGKAVSSAELTQRSLGEGVRVVPIKAGLQGILFAPPGEGRHPGVLVLGGSEGGLPVDKALWLSAHGYSAFALAYFNNGDGLPKKLSAIPLEYFGQAIAWMMNRPEIDPEKIAVVGASRGGELALQLGSMFGQIKAVVAYVPASYRHAACCGSTPHEYAWTWNGTPLSFASARDIQDLLSVRFAEIPVERIKGPVLLVSGSSDHVWPSSMMTADMEGRLKSAHFAYPVERLNYTKAGHLAGRPAIAPVWHTEFSEKDSDAKEDWGGSPQGDAESTLDAIPKVLDFLCHSLGTCPANP